MPETIDSRHAGSGRAVSRLRHGKYLSLLVALVLLVAVYPVLHGFVGGRLLLDVLFTAVLLSALLAIFAERRLRLLAVVLAIPTLVGAWNEYALPGLPRLPLAVGF